MDKAFWPVTMSLDDFVAGQDDAMDWVFGYVALTDLTRKLGSGETPIASDFSSKRAILNEIIRTTGSVLSGRRSYRRLGSSKPHRLRDP